MIPAQFVDRLRLLFSTDDLGFTLDSFSSPELLSIRINPFKSSLNEISSIFKAEGVLLHPVPWSEDVFVLENIPRDVLSRHALVSAGKIYQQSLASMIPAVILSAGPGEHVLDACAAPGSKTTQVAAMMKGQGTLIAVEAVKARFFRLRSVVELLGALNVSCKLCDIRRFKAGDDILFDRILVDAPCSSEGRFRADDPKSTGYWSLRKIKEMSFKQKGILMSASRLLKSGGVLVYATCTFAPEENEEVIDWFLRKSEGAFVLEPIELTGVPRTPCVTQWGRNAFSPEVMKCWRVKPDKKYTGFFVAKLRRA
ncbi:MAG: RsmB/NOP family class I SAM-dependent RNA methyltransferase [Candidatus Omnitrophica bacterium]|nr:RsmB/NOP family class I SAM-dependent RNA methyltransferase [Candidatus Omnitrophota bacterium]